MSTEAATQWILKLKDDEELLKTVASIDDFEEKMALAKEHGFEFTIDEAKQAAVSLSQELSDDDLDNVSGGASQVEQGAAGGAVAGAANGAAIGTMICPGIGTIFGTFMGAALGVTGGSLMGRGMEDE